MPGLSYCFKRGLFVGNLSVFIIKELVWVLAVDLPDITAGDLDFIPG